MRRSVMVFTVQLQDRTGVAVLRRPLCQIKALSTDSNDHTKRPYLTPLAFELNIKNQKSFVEISYSVRLLHHLKWHNG